MENKKCLFKSIYKVLFLVGFVSLFLLLFSMIGMAIIEPQVEVFNFLINCLYLTLTILSVSFLLAVIVNWGTITNETKKYLEC